MQQKVQISENRSRVTLFETEDQKKFEPFQRTLKLLKLSRKIDIF